MKKAAPSLPFKKTEKISSGDLEEIIKEGETGNVEFKASLVWDYHQNKRDDQRISDVIKTIAAFLNHSEGGTLLIGIKDDGTVIGISKDFEVLGGENSVLQQDRFRTKLIGSIKDKISDGRTHLASKIKFEIRQIGSKKIGVVSVAASSVPVFVAPNEDFYVRNDSSSEKLKTRDANNYISSHFGER